LEWQNKDHKNFYDNVNQEFSMVFCINSYHSCLVFFVVVLFAFNSHNTEKELKYLPGSELQYSYALK